MQRAQERKIRELKRQTVKMQDASDFMDHPELKAAATEDHQAMAVKLKAAEKELQTAKRAKSGLTSGGNDGIIKGKSFEEYTNNPAILGETTPKEKYDSYVQKGFVVKPLGRGNFKGVPFESGGEYRVYFDESMQKSLMYHPEKTFSSRRSIL